MSRDIEIAPSRDTDIDGLLHKILMELKKMNVYLALMNNMLVQAEDVEE